MYCLFSTTIKNKLCFTSDMTDALGELAQDFAADAAKDKAKDEVLSFGKSLFG